MAAVNKVTGKDGKVSHGAAPTDIPIVGFSVTRGAKEPLDATDNSDASGGYEVFLPTGWKNWTADIRCKYDTAATYPALDTELDFTFTLETGDTLAGKGIITSEPVELDALGGSVVMKSFTVKGTGALT